MAESAGESKVYLKKTEVIVAIIGVVGVLFTAILSNWDKLFNDGGTVSASYVGYRPTGNFETEMRYFMEINGTRKMLEDLQEKSANQLREQITAQYPEDKYKIDKFFLEIKKLAPSYEEIVKKVLPIWSKYYTVKEIQELNKFYSTDVMQAMISKQPAINQEFVPVYISIIQEYQSKAIEKSNEIFGDDLRE